MCKITTRNLIRTPSDEVILETALWAAVLAAPRYSLISGFGHGGMVEYWLTTGIADELANLGLYCCLERFTETIMDDAAADKNRMEKEDKGRKIDITFYDPAEHPNDAELRGLIEVKGFKSQLPTVQEQADRLRRLRKLLNDAPKVASDILCCMVYVTGESEDDSFRKNERGVMASALGIVASSIMESKSYASLDPANAGKWQVFVGCLKGQ